jgi:hypothetical protein
VTADKPKLTPIETAASQNDTDQNKATSIFDDLDKLRSEATLTVRKREVRRGLGRRGLRQ